MIPVWIAAICVLVFCVSLFCFTPTRTILLQCLSGLDRYKFICKIELMTDETRPANQDQLFCVRMIGRIPTPEDHFDTDVRIEITDLTDGLLNPQPILSADKNFRSSDSVSFNFITHNGIVPRKNAVLSRWVTVTQIPCHILRFACRGRRKLLFRVSVLAKHTGEILTADQKTIEYVYCADGYREIQERRIAVLKASVQLAVAASADEPDVVTVVNQTISSWLDIKAARFAPAAELKQMLDSIWQDKKNNTIESIVEPLQAFGDHVDKLNALELSLHAAACGAVVSQEQTNTLVLMAQQLKIRKERFLLLSQKILLAADCEIRNPQVLLGVFDQMDEQALRKTLNEEYRKWNARVTHPDEEIRQQADRILTLIADLRSHSAVRSGI